MMADPFIMRRIRRRIAPRKMGIASACSLLPLLLLFVATIPCISSWGTTAGHWQFGSKSAQHWHWRRMEDRDYHFLRSTRSNRRKWGYVICLDNERGDTAASSTWTPPASSRTESASSQSQRAQSPPNKIPQSKSKWFGTDHLNKIKEDVDMISFLEAYGLDQFKRTGANRATALCPFHEDTNPSLSMDGDRGLYKCFSCGAGGDVYNFVRQYHKQTQGEEVPFMVAVRHVGDYSTGALPDGCVGNIQISSSTNTNDNFGGQSFRMTEQERQELAEKRERIYAMNQDTATFYLQCLTLPFAGGARQYLQSRGFKAPATIRAFALGFAPDVYFNRQNLPKDQISLVDHLYGRGYNASEILESGLAIQKKTTRNKGNSASSVTAGNQTEEKVDVSSLMDRFRGRLVVPIIDKTGGKVLAFGGRILPPPDDDDDDVEGPQQQQSDFKAPKYLNSPETAVFQKKNVLFGHHIVEQENKRAKAKKSSAETRSDPLLIVEGYMDVLSLWDTGIKTAVASMGTAISMEQITAAAKIAAPNGGKVVLCLDSDDAGIAAVERLCSGSFLMNAARSHSVQFLVASLPSGMKDPGDFIEMWRSKNKDNREIAEGFRKDVIARAIDWSDWYLANILDSYDENAAREAVGSFGSVFKRVSEFLATSQGPAERTKCAVEISGKLAKIMAVDSNRTTISQAAQVQLESDLIDSASRIANARESIKRRAEAASEELGTNTQSLLASLSRGGTSTGGAEDIEKMSRKAFGKLAGASQIAPSAKKTYQRLENSVGQPGARPRRRIYRPNSEKNAEPSITPHFAGFEFENQSDADWLGIPRNKAIRDLTVLTLGGQPYYEDQDVQTKREKNKAIYFNSNDYHGHRFISEEAANAGYSEKMPPMDFSAIMDQGVGAMVHQDVESTLSAAEEVLLQCLVQHYPVSRNAVRDVMQASSSVGSDANIEWSCPDRKWLFQCLVEGDAMEPSDGAMCDTSGLRALLANREDVPTGAFQQNISAPLPIPDTTELLTSLPPLAPSNSTHRPGSLDAFFAHEPSLPESVVVTNYNDSTALFVQNEKASLAAQEHLMTLLSASAAKEISTIQQEMKSVSFVLQARCSSSLVEGDSMSEAQEGAMEIDREAKGGTNSTSPSSDLIHISREDAARNPNLVRFQNKSVHEVNTYYQVCLGSYQQAIERRNKLNSSSRRIMERLMRFSSSTSSETVEGRISMPLQRRIAEGLDNFVAQLEEEDQVGMRPEIDEDDRLGIRETTDKSIKDELAEIEKNWGDWSDEDYVWSPADANANAGSMQYSAATADDLFGEEDDDETLEEALERIENDWKGWDLD